MSRQADEQRQRRKNPSGSSSIKPKGKLVNYHPPKEVVEELRKGIYGPLEAIEALDDLVVNGHRVSMGANLDRGGYFVIIREGLPDWHDAVSVSFWARDLAKAITLAGYYLSYVNEEFPSGVQLELDLPDF